MYGVLMGRLEGKGANEEVGCKDINWKYLAQGSGEAMNLQVPSQTIS